MGLSQQFPGGGSGGSMLVNLPIYSGTSPTVNIPAGGGAAFINTSGPSTTANLPTNPKSGDTVMLFFGGTAADGIKNFVLSAGTKQLWYTPYTLGDSGKSTQIKPSQGNAAFAGSVTLYFYSELGAWLLQSTVGISGWIPV